MPDEIRRDQVVDLMEHGAQLIEVLSRRQYEEIHIARAVSIPLAQLNEERASELDRDRPVIPYCYDFQ